MLLAQKLLMAVNAASGGGSNVLFIDSAVTANNQSTSLNVIRPTTYAEGDYIIVFVGSESGSQLSPITPSAGFSTLAARTSSNVCGVYLKTATASEPSTYAFTVGSTQFCDCITIVVRNGTGTVNSVFSEDGTAASVNMPSAGLLFTFHNVEPAAVFIPPTGMTTVAVQQTGDSACGLATLAVTSGATGDKTSATSGSNLNSISVGVY